MNNLLKKLGLSIVLIAILLLGIFSCLNLSNNQTPIDIVFITDDNYALQARCAIKSIIKNKNFKTKLEINVLGFDLSDENIKKIYSQQRLNSKINVIKVSDNDIHGLNSSSTISTHVTKADYLKFFLPSIFKNKDKILYLDSDTIVLKDLSELFNTDIGDNYLGAVDEWNIEYTKKSKLPDYFNNGIMLLNLKKMREDNIEKKLLNCKLKDKTNEYVTQDTFNKVIDKIYYLHLKYNVLPTVYDLYDDNKTLSNLIQTTLNDRYNPLLYLYDESEEFRKETVIIHYASSKKPCYITNFKRKSYRIWYKYAPLEFWMSKAKKVLKRI